uniref:Uncharacterized protein n=1 Tax=Caenorhabditis japonica TaxID=281687 RepID=A0A8R1HHN1_CAEJA
MTQEKKKSQYFSNGDFEKVAADIISSPRKLKTTADSSSSTESLFRISEKQQEYYAKCFRHLIKTTQGAIDLTGAVCGADQRIVAFFKRSSLDLNSLSKIWTLADVNEDGWLDLNEFSIAMHLVVLKVKGEVPIPDALPAFAKPPITPQRERSQSVVSERLIASPWAGAGAEQIRPAIKNFSNTPPLLVDSRPTAIKHSALLATPDSIPPPIPQRITPSPLPKVIEEEKRAVTSEDVGTQTEGQFYSEEDVNEFFGNIGQQMSDLLGEEAAASEGNGIERWSTRCRALREQNAELETERARLAQVRIQLEIRLQEFEERSKTACSSSTL